MLEAMAILFIRQWRFVFVKVWSKTAKLSVLAQASPAQTSLIHAGIFRNAVDHSATCRSELRLSCNRVFTEMERNNNSASVL